MGGLRHFSGALRPFRHSSRGLPSGSAIWCPSSLRCAEAHYSGFVGRASSMWLLGEYGIFLFCSPRFWFVGFFFGARFPPREASILPLKNRSKRLFFTKICIYFFYKLKWLWSLFVLIFKGTSSRQYRLGVIHIDQAGILMANPGLWFRGPAGGNQLLVVRD